jgi:hypothetical protein
MHTLLSSRPDSGSPIHVLADLSYRTLAAALLALVLAVGDCPSAAAEIPEPEGLSGSDRAAQAAPADSIWLNLRVYPLAVWGPRAGFGGGAGLVVHNPVGTGTQALVTVAPARHDQSGTVTLATTGDVGTARRFALLDARIRHTDRQWFYGLGPASSDETRATLDLWSWNVRLRSGLRFWDRRLLVQPHVRVTQFRSGGVEGRTASPAPDLSDHLADLSGPGGVVADALTGIVVGTDAAVDTRDRASAPVRGLLVQGSAERFTGFDAGDPTFDRFSGEIGGWIPLGGRHRITLLASAHLTRQRSGSVVPFFLRSSLDGRRIPGYARDRFVDNDRFAAGALYRFPLYEYGNVFAIEGHAGVHAGSVYRNLFDQFDLSVSFDESPVSRDRASEPVPLRPAVSAGIRAGPLFRDQSFLDLAVGVSPEGVSGVRVTFIQPLTPLRQPHHRDWF